MMYDPCSLNPAYNSELFFVFQVRNGSIIIEFEVNGNEDEAMKLESFKEGIKTGEIVIKYKYAICIYVQLYAPDDTDSFICLLLILQCCLA